LGEQIGAGNGYRRACPSAIKFSRKGKIFSIDFCSYAIGEFRPKFFVCFVFHSGDRIVFFSGSVKMKMTFPDGFIHLARKPRARFKDAPSINGLLAAE
jgi:hypothetical protein